jgi:hypothetical protein
VQVSVASLLCLPQVQASDSPGDYVQFFSISMEEYFAIRQEEARGRYLPEIVAIC